MCFLFVFFIGLRSSNIGTDSPGYAKSFINAPDLSWDVIKGFFSKKEPFFYFLQSLVRSITESYTVWFLFIAIVYMIPVSCFIYKYSEMPFMSFILFMSMAYMNFAMAGLRQTLATAFLLVSFNFVFKKKFFRFIFLVLLASGFHITSLVFILVMFIRKSKVKAWHIVASILGLFLCLLFGQNLISFIVKFAFGDESYYIKSEFGGYSTLILFVAIVIAALIFNKNIYSSNQDGKNEDAFFLKILLLSLPFQAMAVYQANCFRIAMYFSFFGILTIVPKALSIQQDKTIRIFGIGLTLVLILIQLFFITYNVNDVNPYEFFWQV